MAPIATEMALIKEKKLQLRKLNGPELFHWLGLVLNALFFIICLCFQFHNCLTLLILVLCKAHHVSTSVPYFLCSAWNEVQLTRESQLRDWHRSPVLLHCMVACSIKSCKAQETQVHCCMRTAVAPKFSTSQILNRKSPVQHSSCHSLLWISLLWLFNFFPGVPFKGQGL